jgi:hypothetical protein
MSLFSRKDWKEVQAPTQRVQLPYINNHEGKHTLKITSFRSGYNRNKGGAPYFAFDAEVTSSTDDSLVGVSVAHVENVNHLDMFRDRMRKVLSMLTGSDINDMSPQEAQELFESEDSEQFSGKELVMRVYKSDRMRNDGTPFLNHAYGE